MKRSEKTIGPYLILFTIVLSWNAIWWFLVTPEGYPEVASTHDFHVQYFPASSAQGNVGIDPAIFSLPSRVGFSKVALSSRDSILPPLEFEKSLSIFMMRSSEINSSISGLDVEPMDSQLIQLIKRGPIAGGVSTDEKDPKVLLQNTIVWDVEGVDLEGASLGVWAEALSTLTNIPWSISFSFDTDPVGFIEHVFVEQSTGDKGLDGMLRASMSTLQFVPDEKVGMGRLWIKHLVLKEPSE